MKTYIRLLLWLIVCFTCFGFAFAYAADGTTATGWGWTWLTPYVPMLIPALAGLQSVLVREQSATNGFWHTMWGQATLTGVGAFLGGLVDVLRAGAVTKTALIAAIAGAIAAFFGAWKITGKSPTADTTTTAKLSPPIKPAMLLPFIAIGLSLLSSCACWQPAHVTDPKCVVARKLVDCTLPAVAQGTTAALADVLVALSGGAPDWAALAQAEGKYGADAVACAVQEAAMMATGAATAVGTAHMAELKNNPVNVRANAAAYLAVKPVRFK